MNYGAPFCATEDNRLKTEHSGSFSMAFTCVELK